jgi:hypothetical protein
LVLPIGHLKFVEMWDFMDSWNLAFSFVKLYI